ncbi:MAG: hypothetical protein LUG17_04165, partial [Clostridiales bacterium]|nr:hypothetical protein [Clostridiales bacterium]
CQRASLKTIAPCYCNSSLPSFYVLSPFGLFLTGKAAHFFVLIAGKGVPTIIFSLIALRRMTRLASWLLQASRA